MDYNILENISLLVVGAALALFGGIVNEIFKQKNDKRKAKLALLKNFSGQTMLVRRLLDRSISHQVWFHYYHQTMVLDTQLKLSDRGRSQYETVDLDDLKKNAQYRIEELEKIELELIKSDSKFGELAAEYTYFFGSDKIFEEKLEQIMAFNLDDFTIENFSSYSSISKMLDLNNNEIKKIISEIQLRVKDQLLPLIDEITGLILNRVK